MKLTALIAVLLLAAPFDAVAADVIAPQPATLSIPTSRDDLKNCEFITNDCEVCTVDPTGRANCSSQGIACTPTKRWCLIPKK